MELSSQDDCSLSILHSATMLLYDCTTTTMNNDDYKNGKRKQGKIVIAFIWHCYCLVARVVSLVCDKKRGQYRLQRLRRLLSISFIISLLVLSLLIIPSAPASVYKTKKEKLSAKKKVRNLWTFFLFHFSIRLWNVWCRDDWRLTNERTNVVYEEYKTWKNNFQIGNFKMDRCALCKILVVVFFFFLMLLMMRRMIVKYIIVTGILKIMAMWCDLLEGIHSSWITLFLLNIVFLMIFM